MDTFFGGINDGISDTRGFGGCFNDIGLCVYENLVFKE